MLPIVLAHGYFGFSELGPEKYFRNAADQLKQLGADDVLATIVKPLGSVADRAAALKQQITDAFGNGPVHVIAHSMGGLDARWIIGRLGGEALIRTLTTLGTPFAGTPIADIMVGNQVPLPNPLLAAKALFDFEANKPGAAAVSLIQDARFGFDQSIDLFRQLLIDRNLSGLATYIKALFPPDFAIGDLTTRKCAAAFPDETDLKGVPLFCHAGSLPWSRVSPPLIGTAMLMTLLLSGENDGMVPLSSAKRAGQGITEPDDHFGLVGWSANNLTPMWTTIAENLKQF